MDERIKSEHCIYIKVHKINNGKSIIYEIKSYYINILVIAYPQFFIEVANGSERA
jgi:hypothetical protein